MACFTLTDAQAQMIVDLMQVGYDGAEFDNDEDNEAIAAFMDELGSATGPIEITVVRVENDPRVIAANTLSHDALVLAAQHGVALSSTDPDGLIVSA